MFRITPAGLITAAATVAGLALLVRWLEPRVAFYPIRGVQETPAVFDLPFTDLEIPTADGETLHGWWLEAPAPARGQVMFFHGNGGNLSLWLDVIADIRRHGFSVLALDYRGYGASTGRPTEQGLYRDAEAALRSFDRLRRRGSPVIYWGRSIGCPVAAQAAARAAPDGLILETPMSDVRSLLRRNPVMWLLSFLSAYRFPTAGLVQRLDMPLLVVHGDADSIVPYASGRRVFEAARSAKKTFITIPAADHNDLHVVNPAVYWKAIDAFTSGLQASR